MSHRLLPLLLLPVLAFGLGTTAQAAPTTDLEAPAPFTAGGGLTEYEVTGEDDYYIEFTKDNGDGTSIVHTRSKKTGYWTTHTKDSDGNSTEVASGDGDGEFKSGGRPTPVPMGNNGSITVVHGNGWIRTTLNNPDGTAIIHIHRIDGTWTLRAENANGNDRVVAVGDGEGNVFFPK